MTKRKIAIIGSGNWGSAIAKIIGLNVAKFPELFDQEVKIWCKEEIVDGKKLTELWKERNENVKYLPGIKIPANVIAVPDLVEAARGANALVFVLPHQFLGSVCKELHDHISSDVVSISLIKGVEVQSGKIRTIPEMIESRLGTPCSALSGANIGWEVALEKFAETTIGCSQADDGVMWKNLFHTDYFRVRVTDDVAGVSLCGALKNVVAIAAGFIDGLGWGNNAKAAIMRTGLVEMKKFSMEFFSGVRPETFSDESAGVADLITSCLGGRNRQIGEAYIGSRKTFSKLEAELLNGQSAQGVGTAMEIYTFLSSVEKTASYPLFTFVYRVCFEDIQPHSITAHL